MPVEVSYGSTPQTVPDPITGAVDGVYSKNAEHVAEAISHLISRFREDCPRNQSVLTAVGTQVQELEDAIWAHSQAFDVDTAVGDQLDLIGKRVGEYRADRSDGLYRAAIRVRILVNRSDGKPEQLIAIGVAMSPTADIIYREGYPASFSMEFSTLGTSTLSQTNTIIRLAKPAGVRANVIGLGDDATLGAADGDPPGGVMGADPATHLPGDPEGFFMAGGT